MPDGYCALPRLDRVGRAFTASYHPHCAPIVAGYVKLLVHPLTITPCPGIRSGLIKPVILSPPIPKISKRAACHQRLELSFHTMRIFACSFGLLLQLLCFGYAGLQILNTRSMGRMCREKFDRTRALTCLLHF